MLVNTKVPDCFFSTTHNLQSCFNDYQGKWLILFFYPKDATPGCTIESRDFRDQYSDLINLNAEVLGVSRDSLPSHELFKTKQSLPFELISDPDEVLCQHFDVMKIKSMYGKKLRGIERSTFLINPEGIITHEWRRVKVIGHVEAIKSVLENSRNNS